MVQQPAAAPQTVPAPAAQPQTPQQTTAAEPATPTAVSKPQPVVEKPAAAPAPAAKQEPKPAPAQAPAPKPAQKVIRRTVTNLPEAEKAEQGRGRSSWCSCSSLFSLFWECVRHNTWAMMSPTISRSLTNYGASRISRSHRNLSQSMLGKRSF